MLIIYEHHAYVEKDEEDLYYEDISTLPQKVNKVATKSVWERQLQVQ